jgi:hypothetical protein
VPTKVKQQLLKPGLPPMYLVEGIKNASYTKNELQIVKPDEKAPDPRKLKNPTKFIIKEILAKKKIKNRIYYLIHWKGYDDKKDYTLEPRTQLLKDAPAVVNQYENNLK